MDRSDYRGGTRERGRWVTGTLLVAAALAAGAAPSRAAAGPADFDQTFGSGGSVTSDWGSPHAVTVTPDGKPVVAGTRAIGSGLTVALYSVGGALDSSFNGTGVSTGPASYGVAVGVAPDGKIVAAGTAPGASGQDFAADRFTPSGALDPGFSGDGEATTSFTPTADSGEGVAIGGDGSVVVAGTTGDLDFGLVRFDSNGNPDLGFGPASDATVRTDFGSSDEANAVAMQSDGTLVAVGRSGLNFAVARYTASGLPDNGFNGNGRVITPFPGTAIANAVAAQPDGRVVVAGGESDFKLARYNPDGSLDPSFGSGGKVVTDLGGNRDVARGVVVQPDGKIVVAGEAKNEVIATTPTSDMAIVRYNPDGSLDQGFGNGGIARIRPGGSSAYGLALMPDGRIVVVGTDVDVYVLLVRLLGTDDPDTRIDKVKVKRKKRRATIDLSMVTGTPPPSFSCKLKKPRKKHHHARLRPAKFAPCGAEETYKHLRSGRYKLSVTATDAAGRSDPTPAKRKFKVKRRRK